MSAALSTVAKQAARTGDAPSAPRLKAFVCYARQDLDVVLETLTALFGREIEFLQDLNDILPSEPWEERVRSLISKSDLVLYFASNWSVASKPCQEELDYADSLGKRIFPVVLERGLDERMPDSVRAIQWFFADRSGPLDIDALHAAIVTDAEWVRAHTRYLVAAQDWLASGQSTRRLLRGRDVAGALAWAKERPPSAPEVLPLHDQYFRASRTLRRVLRAATAGVTVAGFAGAIVLYGLSLENRRGYSDVLARDAARLLNDGAAPVEVVRTAIASWILDPEKYAEGTPRSQSVAVIAEALSHQRLRSILDISKLPDGIGDQAFSSRLTPGGRYLVLDWQDEPAMALAPDAVVENDPGAEAKIVPVPPEPLPDWSDITWQSRIVDLGTGLVLPQAPAATDPLTGVGGGNGFSGRVVISGDGSTLAWPLPDDRLLVYRPGTGEPANFVAAGNAQGAIIALDPGGQRLIAEADDGLVIRSLTGGAPVPMRPSLPDEARSLFITARQAVFSSDGRYLAASVSYDIGGPAASRVCIFDTASGDEIVCSVRDPSFASAAPFYNVNIGPMAFSPDNTWLAYADWENNLRVLDRETGEIDAFETGAGGFVTDLLVSPNGRYIAVSSKNNAMVGGVDHPLVILDIKGRTFFRSGRIADIDEIELSSDGRTLTAVGGGGVVTRWDVGFGAMTEQLVRSDRMSSDLSAISGGYSPRFEETFVLHGDRETFDPEQPFESVVPGYAGYERRFIVYDLPSTRVLRELPVAQSYLLQAAVADEQDLIAVIRRNADRVELFSYSSFETLKEIEEIPSHPTDVHIARRAEVIAVGNGAGEIMVIDGDRRREYGVAGEVTRVVLSPNARYLAVLFREREGTASNSVRVWDIEGADESILELSGVSSLSRSAFADELPRFAVARGDALVYDLPSRSIYARLSSARGLNILDAAISDAGFHVATSEDTGPVLLHDVETEEAVFVVGGHSFGTSSVEFGSLGLTLTTLAASFTELRHWNVALRDYNLFRVACRSLPARYRSAPLDMVEVRPTAGIFASPELDCDALELPGPRR